jgi:ribonuclease P protein component
VVRTIKSSRDVDALFRSGRRGARATVIVLRGDTPEGRDPDGRVVFVAGKRLGGAVLRNRCKRVLRASCRRLGHEWPGSDVALIATKATPAAPVTTLDEDLARALEQAGVVR